MENSFQDNKKLYNYQRVPLNDTSSSNSSPCSEGGSPNRRRYRRRLPDGFDPGGGGGSVEMFRKCFYTVIGVSVLIFVLLPLAFHMRTKRPLFKQPPIVKPIAEVWPKNQTRNARLLISPKLNTNLITPRNICTKKELSEDLHKGENLILVAVCSSIGNFEDRQVVRKSWASPELTPAGVKVIFVLGSHKNQTLYRKELTDESTRHGDILQMDFIDSYANLTVKTLAALKFYTEEGCDNTRFILKTDDDMYINLNVLKQTALKSLQAKDTTLMTGNLICGAKPIRDPTNKWNSPRYMFNGKQYPNYLSGTAYLIARDAALSLYQASLETPVFHLEDIYTTGILARTVGIRPKDNRAFSYDKRKFEPCLFSQIVSSHHHTKDELLEIAGEMKKAMKERKRCRILKGARLRAHDAGGKCKWP